jgi:CheY-like chemotaxis protein/HPt (histidine-containing phosphotransfer) domain-containing protein
MATTPITQLRVLLAEDNPVNQLFAARLVERQGHSVRVVSNGQLALNAIRHEKFDVVLIDIGMPVMDGLEAVRELRQLEKQTGRHLPVIAMTASTSELDRDRCRAAGMDDFVGKPVQTADLATAMARVLRDTAQTCADIGTPYPVETDTNQRLACDLTSALKRVGGDLNFLKQLGQLFLDTVPLQLQSLRTAMENRNRKLIGDLAHSMKGSVRHFFAATAYDFAQRLELISMTGDIAVIEQTYERLLSEVERLRTELLSVLFSLREASPNSGVF